jgi:hypothetical protein
MTKQRSKMESTPPFGDNMSCAPVYHFSTLSTRKLQEMLLSNEVGQNLHLH